MVVFNKKRILFLTMCLVVSFIGLNLDFNQNFNTVPVSSTPVSGYTIVLDAGHGMPDRRSCFWITVCMKKRLI